MKKRNRVKSGEGMKKAMRNGAKLIAPKFTTSLHSISFRRGTVLSLHSTTPLRLISDKGGGTVPSLHCDVVEVVLYVKIIPVNIYRHDMIH